ncbi:MAG TPA: helix-turn-helix domain-containing protein [Mycobacteriales bacterium]|nr:helix-turn-helix domain-containing protein [Mycobacteriales bacterium]
MTVTATNEEDTMPRLLLTPTEAAEALGIGRSKLYELLKSGVVPSITIGACRRIVASDLAIVVEQLKSAQQVAPAATPTR